MINSFANIGKSLLTNQKTSSEYEAKKRFLEQVAITPYIKNDKNALGKAICLNFNLNKDCAEFILSDDDLSSENKSKFFAHSQKGNTKNIFLNTSSIITLITSTASDSIKALTEDWKNWSKNNVDSDYINLLKQLMKKFYYYDQHTKKYILNPEKLSDKNKEKFYKIKEEKQEKNNEIIYKYLLNSLYFDRDSKNTNSFPNVTKLLINNQYILEHKENKFAQSYVNIIYYALLGSHFTKDKLENKICHVCNKKTTVLKSSYPLPMKFFGTTNFLFFNDLDNKKSYQSFAICEDCARDAFAGMKFVENNFNTYLFNITCFLIPNLAKEEHFESNL
ncbi:TM1802 family CRISPR-associated protein, partial [Flexistipes sp.]|uniref:TM1802 family CRISPR-associated protein n=1 Tax=Flexistipes sp. TaxID=3088135 RepID=UPI002E20CE77|nr:TM1802 family CRISPR-associated protein [Flexistipes sp.]